MLRVVVDTNVFVSSFLSKSGAPAKVIDGWRGRLFVLLTSHPIVDEIISVLKSRDIQKRYLVSDSDADQIEILLTKDALWVTGEIDESGAIPDDPSDEIFLACAVEGGVDAIVSGDSHLLMLGQYRGIRIISTRQFLEELVST